MKLAQALRLLPGSEDFSRVTAFVGAGGKTTAMFRLARELPPPVIVTCTTHLGAWQTSLADEHVVITSSTDLGQLTPHDVTLVTGPNDGDRTRGLEEKEISWLHEICATNNLPLLIEADGSNQTPLKAPAAHEPVLPPFVDLVVHVFGLSGLGKPLEESVFRPEIFARLSGLKLGEKVTPDSLVCVLTHPEGGLKNVPATSRCIALLNQADTPELAAVARTISGRILSEFDAVVTSSLRDGVILAVQEPIAGIVLAAGASTRFGQPKQLLDWHGVPFIRAIASTALQAGLWPVVVVTGAHADDVESALSGLEVTLVHNREWETGQASSIRAGLAPLSSPESGTRSGAPGGVIFLLADQPQVNPSVIRALSEEHTRTLAPVIAPFVIDRRANPVLFDRVTFPDLEGLRGDIGGRGIFSKFRIQYLPWHDEALLRDVDTPEDYQRLLKTLE